MNKIIYLIIILIIATTTEAFMLVNQQSPYPDYYGTDGANDTRIDTNIVDSKRITLNNYQYETPARLGAVPGCSSKEDCNLLVDNIIFYFNNVQYNTEQHYPFDFKYPINATNSEDVDVIPDGIHTLKAIVTKVDGSTLEMSARFFVGKPSLQQIDNLTLFMYTSDKNVSVQWDLNPNPVSHYDIHVTHVENEELLITGKVPQPADPNVAKTGEFTFKVPRTGHYIFKVRAVIFPFSDAILTDIDSKKTIDDLKTYIKSTYICDYQKWIDNTWNTVDDLKAHVKEVNSYCSDWSNSTDSNVATIKGEDGKIVNQGWWVFGWPAAPTGGGITTN